MLNMPLVSLLTAIYIILLSACSPQSENKTSKVVRLSPELSGIYQRSCKTCHETQATGAPLTGDKTRWNEVLNQGMSTVLEHAMSGYKGMPAFGQCFECRPEQIEALITYMSNPKR